MKNRFLSLLFLCVCATSLYAQPADFIPGYNVIFQDNFELDAIGDFPAKWSTNGSGEVVTLDEADGRWMKIMMPTAVSPELRKKLPENYTIEFDLFLKGTTGVAPVVTFGLTTLSDVSNGNVYRSSIGFRMHRYNTSNATVMHVKNMQKLGERKFDLQGYINRVMRVSIAVNKTRLRIYLDEEKVLDLPKLLTPEYRNNFFIASTTVMPDPTEGVYVSNVRIAEGDVDARSLLVKQLLEEGRALTGDIQFNERNEITPESQPYIDQLGQALQQHPEMNIQINGLPMPDDGTAKKLSLKKDALKQRAEKIKAYLVAKFQLEKARIVADATTKAVTAADRSKLPGKAKQYLTEIIRL